MDAAHDLRAKLIRNVGSEAKTREQREPLYDSVGARLEDDFDYRGGEP